MIYRECEVLFANLTNPNDLSGKYELVLLCQDGSATAKALAAVCQAHPDRDGDGVLRFRGKSNNRITCWRRGAKVQDTEVKRGCVVDIDAKLVPWEYKGRRGTSLWINAINLVRDAPAMPEHDDNRCPFGDEYPF